MAQPNTPGHVSARAASLVRELAMSCKEKYGINKTSTTIYDTAWVAMVSKTVNGEKSWAFPESFQYILDHQSQDGAWESYASEIDGIMNTLAALLAIQKHAAESQSQLSFPPSGVEDRISRATKALEGMLQSWKVEETNYVAFEMLVPAHLDMLERYNIRFDFPGRQHLMSINKQKLAKLDTRSLSEAKGGSLLYSLEAFLGKINFDDVRHHTVAGSMLGSPSSTAAYMIGTSAWDDESEAYLRWVISTGTGEGSGAVPSSFPTTIFDLSWVVTNLFEGCFPPEILQSEYLDIIGGELERLMQVQDGLVGFAPNFHTDADCTAKTIIALSLLGRPTSADRLVAEFEGITYFHTYLGERHHGFSVNCHVLKALLCGTDRVKHTPQIIKVARFLCDSWWNGTINEKWNNTPQYPMMAMSQGLVALLDCWEKGVLPNLPDTILRDRIPVVLIGVLIHTLQSQNVDGSWGNVASGEQTAYAVMTLASISCLPWFKQLQCQMKIAIDRGRDFIKKVDVESSKPEYLWITKLSYGMNFLSQSYILAAQNLEWPARQLGPKVDHLVHIPLERTTELTNFYRQLPLFSSTPEWMILASVIEGYFFMPYLKRIRLDIFTRRGVQVDTYFELIPSTWTLSSQPNDAALSPQILLDLMIISFLIFQVDEYIEAIVGKYFKNRIDDVRRAVDHTLDKAQAYSIAATNSSDKTQDLHERNGESTPSSTAKDVAEAELGETSVSLKEVQATLGHFVARIMQNDGVKKASEYDQENLRGELRAYLFAQLVSIEENLHLAEQNASCTDITSFKSPDGSFFEWVRGTAASHSAGKLAFVFLSCLVGRENLECFPGAEAKYFAQDMSLHLATMGRMYNDYGSIARDRHEMNLNSVNFPEFDDGKVNGRREGKDQVQGQSRWELELKPKLLRLAEYERDCFKTALGRLEQMLESRVTNALTSLSNAYELHGQISLVRDISAPLAD